MAQDKWINTLSWRTVRSVGDLAAHKPLRKQLAHWRVGDGGVTEVTQELRRRFARTANSSVKNKLKLNDESGSGVSNRSSLGANRKDGINYTLNQYTTTIGGFGLLQANPHFWPVS